MKRSILGFFAGLATWVVVVSLLNRGLRLFLTGYAQAEPTMHFTLPMMIARLAMAMITSLVAGAVTRLVVRKSDRPACALGVVLLALFLPNHLLIWKAFPVWYHLTFLISLIPLVAVGAHLIATPAEPMLDPPIPPERRRSA